VGGAEAAKLRAWPPARGYTFSAWVCIESYDQFQRRLPLLSLTEDGDVIINVRMIIMIITMVVIMMMRYHNRRWDIRLAWCSLSWTLAGCLSGQSDGVSLAGGDRRWGAFPLFRVSQGLRRGVRSPAQADGGLLLSHRRGAHTATGQDRASEH
jgi:hypothetical protein